MEIDHIADGAIGQRRAKDRNIVLVAEGSKARLEVDGRTQYFICPIIHGFLVVYFFSESPNERARCPKNSGFLLFSQHSIQDGCEPILEFTVIIVWNDEVSNTVHTTLPQFSAIEMEICQVGLSEAFDEIFFDAACCRDKDRDMFVLN